MKSPLCISFLIACFLLSCDLLATPGVLPAATDSHQLNTAASSSGDRELPPPSQVIIPGPLRSFLRMAGISQKITPEEVLPLLSRNVFIQGFNGSTRPTEFLILLRRYVSQARELASLAGANGNVIRVSNCDDARSLLRILGYRTRGTCGESGMSLQTEDPARAFLAIDSGFPLPALEQALQEGTSFEYAFPSASVPVLFGEGDWTRAEKQNSKDSNKDLLDTLLSEAGVARLYWALSKLDPETSNWLQRSIGIPKLLPYGSVLDFYGRRLCLSGGRVVVPGGVSAEPAWKDLVGASPESAAAFIERLLAKDQGWLAAYFDVLSRVSGSQQAYFTEANRLRLFYEGLRSPSISYSATRGSFRPAPALLLLVTRLPMENSREPLIPGSVDVWREILREHNSTFGSKSAKSPPRAGPDLLVQALFSFSRSYTETGPLQQYMTISELDRRRSSGHRLAPATVRLLARKFEEYSDQYRIFSEFPELNDQSIALFLDVAQRLNGLPMAVRGNALGTFQAEIGIWQILARQGQISNSQLDDSWQHVIKPFAAIRSAAQLYNAGRTSLEELFRSSTGKPRGSQDDIIELLAGPRQSTPQGMAIHKELTRRIRSVLDDQRLVSLDTVLTIGDALAQKAQKQQPEEFVTLLAGQLREFEMPRPIFTSNERSEWAAGVYNNHHTEVQMRTNVAKVLNSPTASHAQIEEATGQLASFLRDSLVGLNYAYYEPPGAQALHNNPLFVRSHDFAGETITGMKSLWQAPELLGQGTPAGGGAHFVGSLADLPYALADLEQDFISPDNVQALIWKELTPQLLTTAILPRWWDVSPVELHAVALYQRAGEELLAASASNQALQKDVMNILSDRLLPQRSRQVEQAMRGGNVSQMLPEMMPADTFYLAAEFQRKHPEQAGDWGTATHELQELRRLHPDQVEWKRLSRHFGTPHPNMAQNYGLELLNTAAMPPFSGNASRFLAESWDSPNLYWARLADEAGYSPVALNHLVPELTRRMVEKIFATDFEDWSALLRAMHETGDDFREGKLTSSRTTSTVQP